MTSEKIRIDRWLWAARFFKTRSLATQAVTGGKVQVNGIRVKPARAVQIGEELRIRRGTLECTVIILGLSEKRGPAVMAQALYEETPESMAMREESRERNRLQRAAATIYGSVKRPDKRERRRIITFIRKND